MPKAAKRKAKPMEEEVQAEVDQVDQVEAEAEANTEMEAADDAVEGLSAEEGEDLIDMELDTTLHVALGTYEHLVHGIDCNVIAAKEGDDVIVAAQMKKTYVSEPHAGPVTALEATGNTLVTGSSDELMQYAD
jgi:hypothetical protein